MARALAREFAAAGVSQAPKEAEPRPRGRLNQPRAPFDQGESCLGFHLPQELLVARGPRRTLLARQDGFMAPTAAANPLWTGPEASARPGRRNAP